MRSCIKERIVHVAHVTDNYTVYEAITVIKYYLDHASYGFAASSPQHNGNLQVTCYIIGSRGGSSTPNEPLWLRAWKHIVMKNEVGKL